MTFDVVVIGGGPAGAMTAYRLAAAGVRVAVVDACAFPRDKPCGGGLQHKAARHIPFDWSPTLRGTLHGLSVSLNMSERFTRTSPGPLVYTVWRTEFDAYLLAAAQRAGATLFEATRATGVTRNGQATVTVETSAGPLTARYVVGADGANSIVARVLNPRTSFYWQAGISAEVPEGAIVRDAVDYDRHAHRLGHAPERLRVDLSQGRFAQRRRVVPRGDRKADAAVSRRVHAARGRARAGGRHAPHARPSVADADAAHRPRR